jgi:hypothetical protein
MSTPSGDSVRAEITENALVAGNPVKESTKLPATASKPLFVDENSSMSSGDFPFAIPFVAQSVTDPAISVTGTPNGNIMTQTIVAAASATTVTSAGFFRMDLVSLNEAIFSSGAYYVQLNTLT